MYDMSIFRRSARPWSRGKKRIVKLIVLVVALAALFFIVSEAGLKPNIMEYGENLLHHVAVRAMNEAVAETLQEVGPLDGLL